MAKKSKVIHIITRLDKGGSAENTLLTVLGMDQKKYEVILIKGPTYESRMDKKEHAAVMADLKEAGQKGIKTFNIPFLLRKISPVHDLLALFSLYRFLFKEKPLIVHTHTSKAGLLGRLAARLARTPVIVHTPHGHVFFGYFGQIKSMIFVLLERAAARMTDKIIALTESEKRDYLSFQIADEGQLAVIHSGVELRKFKGLLLEEKQQLKKELGIPQNALVVGTAGRLVTVKGPQFLMEAAQLVISSHPQTIFVFSGGGPLRPHLEKKALETGIQDHVLFLGWRKDVARIMAIYDVFVLPSLNEGMGRALVEAMALGKPIVASNTGGIPDLVTHGENGFLVPPANPKELAKYIRILVDDEEKREKMGRAGKEIAVSFSSDEMIQKIDNLYTELLKQKH